MENRISAILQYWFGHVEESVLPSKHRMWVWFSGDAKVDEEVKTKFAEDFARAEAGDYVSWEDNPRGCLALIILFDQFSRHIYRNLAQAFNYDQKALDLCLKGIERQFDHQLSLIERVFFYMPLMHAENVEMQILSVRAFQMLLALSFPETRSVFENFLNHAVEHYETINRFGRFPHRNVVLARPSTDSELEFLNKKTS